MKRLRVSLLVLALLAALAVFYYRRENSVRVETVNLHSQIMGIDLPYSVVLPRGYGLFFSRKSYPVLYLLHGHGGDHSSWTANSPLTTDAASFSVIIVLPEGKNGWYTDSATDDTSKYETYLVRELIPDVESRYRVIHERSARAIAGYSMGGYGALKFGFKYPGMFVFAGSMSGAFDAPLRDDEISIKQTFGQPGNPVRDANNITKLATQASAQTLPYIYFDCGTEDPWLKTNRELASTFDKLGIKHDYQEATGTHDWSYWGRQIMVVLPLAASTMSPPRR
jgi:S-formylglutathione hydrolase FrmB